MNHTISTRTVRSLTYRIDEIPCDYSTPEELLKCFHSDDKSRVIIRSFVPSISDPDGNEHTATIEYQSEGVPRLDADANGIELDKDFCGFTPLNETEGNVAADIIAVTGLSGHAFGSWVNSRGQMWLLDYLPKDLQQKARILIYGYPSALQGSRSQSSLGDYSNCFMQDLMGIRSHPAMHDRPIIFIGHSLGGLIIKKALADLKPQILLRLPVRSILFFGVPHGGLNIKALQVMVKGQPNENLIRDLRVDSAVLEGLADSFSRIANSIKIYSFVENHETPTVVQVDGKWQRGGEQEMMVSRQSARLRCETETIRPVHADHSQMVKIRRGQNGPYPYIANILKEALQSAPEKWENSQQLKQAFPAGEPRVGKSRLGSVPESSSITMDDLAAKVGDMWQKKVSCPPEPNPAQSQKLDSNESEGELLLASNRLRSSSPPHSRPASAASSRDPRQEALAPDDDDELDEFMFNELTQRGSLTDAFSAICRQAQVYMEVRDFESAERTCHVLLDQQISEGASLADDTVQQTMEILADALDGLGNSQAANEVRHRAWLAKSDVGQQASSLQDPPSSGSWPWASLPTPNAPGFLEPPFQPTMRSLPSSYSPMYSFIPSQPTPSTTLVLPTSKSWDKTFADVEDVLYFLSVSTETVQKGPDILVLDCEDDGCVMRLSARPSPGGLALQLDSSGITLPKHVVSNIQRRLAPMLIGERVLVSYIGIPDRHMAPQDVLMSHEKVLRRLDVEVGTLEGSYTHARHRCRAKKVRVLGANKKVSFHMVHDVLDSPDEAVMAVTFEWMEGDKVFFSEMMTTLSSEILSVNQSLPWAAFGQTQPPPLFTPGVPGLGAGFG
ncbi:uncharacterized protein E0L32_005963 [Thyridium curvatum]|uniref:DUF676 domain-containing protein n=1 Tax=Thyridium curvatum TaxID=1093900 RepID=A0A507AU32_9PEZI|nr:uncharacterized protein E0L32_005963 [Thyridium curvatum]TPX13492.1 hypothetical protein E0L32_005963 [Thyridium curvatum]